MSKRMTSESGSGSPMLRQETCCTEMESRDALFPFEWSLHLGLLNMARASGKGATSMDAELPNHAAWFH